MFCHAAFSEQDSSVGPFLQTLYSKLWILLILITTNAPEYPQRRTRPLVSLNKTPATDVPRFCQY